MCYIMKYTVSLCKISAKLRMGRIGRCELFVLSDAYQGLIYIDDKAFLNLWVDLNVASLT